MTPPFLRDFSTHITAWAQTLIDDGRYPFRRAELCDQLLLPAPIVPAPLVFWINRDSFMAGGVILFADDATAGDIPSAGQHLAAALGLGHFIVWGRTQITFWATLDSTPTVYKTLPAPHSEASTPGDFQSLLARILQELKLLCVAKILAPEALSPSYFANLFFATIDAALPVLSREGRLLRASDGRERSIPAELAAEQKGYLSLLRLAALAAFDRLPPTVQPEGLEQASRYALETLPTAVQPALAFLAVEPPLGSEGAIRFHHLFRRLTQLGVAKDKERIARALELLAVPCAASFNGFPPPPTSTHQPTRLLLVNSDRPGGQTVAAETGATPLLALFSVIRTLRGDLPPRRQGTTPLHLGAELGPDAIVGTLFDPRIPTKRERLALSIRLRSSWPGRRWTLPPATPLWGWELLHLLGVAASEASIDLTIPGGWLDEEFAHPFLDLFGEDFAFEQIAVTPAGRLCVRICRQPNPSPDLVVITAEGEERRLTRRLFDQARSALLALTLALPAESFALLNTGKLRLYGQLAELPPTQQHGMELFCRASLGRLLWSIVGARRPLPAAGQLAPRLAEHGMPFPDAATLEQLAASLPEDPTLPTTNVIDRELSRWFALPPALPPPPDNKSADRARRPGSGSRSKTLEVLISQEVFCDGVPRFPEHYLLDHFRPPTEEFVLSGALSIHSVFFDTITLLDADGAYSKVEGLETARALVLASHCANGHILLPTDRQLTAAILARYLQDLRRLHQRLRRRVYLELADPRQADALCNRIWSRHALPPATLLDR